MRGIYGKALKASRALWVEKVARCKADACLESSYLGGLLCFDGAVALSSSEFHLIALYSLE